VILLLIFLKGEKPRLIRAKLKIGALMLGLTSCCYMDFIRTCYMPTAPKDHISFYNGCFQFAGKTDLIFPTDSLLTGEILNYSKKHYSYKY